MKRATKDRITEAIAWALLAVVLYVVVSCAAFALRNPELTQTQQLLRSLDALLWR